MRAEGEQRPQRRDRPVIAAWRQSQLQLQSQWQPTRAAFVLNAPPALLCRPLTGSSAAVHSAQRIGFGQRERKRFLPLVPAAPERAFAAALSHSTTMHTQLHLDSQQQGESEAGQSS